MKNYACMKEKKNKNMSSRNFPVVMWFLEKKSYKNF